MPNLDVSASGGTDPKPEPPEIEGYTIEITEPLGQGGMGLSGRPHKTDRNVRLP